MLKRLVINDFKANKLITISTCIFMAVTAMLLGLSIFLFASLATSINALMTKAETPHFLQMHTGELDEAKINAFANDRKEVEKKQICKFLNLPNGSLSIGGQSFANNMQDNGLCVQSECFDYLVDANNEVIEAKAGEVYVPVAYKKEYRIQVGDIMQIGTESLTVAGFLRDSQMNSMMASSKRFLVSATDYERLKHLGSEEYLIEFRLKDGSDYSAFATAYKDTGLPENGPTITYPLIRVMNALSDGIMILVILLVSVVVLWISILCIKHILLTQLEKDRREIGMLRAVGITAKEVTFFYLAKYLALSMAGCIVGIIAATALARLLGGDIRELYGETEQKALVYLFMILGALLAEGIILLFIRKTLRGTERESVMSVLSGRGNHRKKSNLWRPAFVIPAAAVFMILVPLGMKNTMANPEFVTYMGIGNSHLRIDVRQSGNDNGAAQQILSAIEKDERVEKHSFMRTRGYKVRLSDGNTYNVMLENGDHGTFPVNYREGTYPKSENEIALSILYAEELGIGVGDAITLYKEEGDGNIQECACSVCGIYSDVTNGGKTAKGCLDDSQIQTPPAWSIIYVSLKDEKAIGEWASEYQKRFSSMDEGIKVISIAEYLQGVYGQTIRNVSDAARMTMALAALIILVVILLLMRLIIWKERRDSSLKKALGMSSAMIRRDYLKKLALFVLSGILLGLLLGNVLGQKLAGGLLSLMGAQGFQFRIDPLECFVLTPLLIVAFAGVAAVVSLTEIKRIRAVECLNSERE
ncbi:MAG: ABC transporter permease [Acetatifactor sp.]|nr:ABC transporter permease [Acetatifactor sp.]